MKYGKRDNEIAEKLRAEGPNFLDSEAWKKMRASVVKTYGRQCMKCKRTPRSPRHTHVDHIKPRKHYPSLALEFNNLQVLCARCNKEKANTVADYRPVITHNRFAALGATAELLQITHEDSEALRHMRSIRAEV